MKETLYDRISYLAASNGMSIAEVERKADLGNGSIRRWRKSIPSADKLYRVSKLFGIAMEDLLDYGNTRPVPLQKIHIKKTVKGLQTTDTGFIEKEYLVQLTKDERGTTIQIDDYIISLSHLNISVEHEKGREIEK